MTEGWSRWIGPTAVAGVFGSSMTVSLYHVQAHVAPLLPMLLGQGSLLALSLLFGVVGYRTLTSVERPNQRRVIGVRAGGGFLLAGAASGGYAIHQFLSPEAVLPFDQVLFHATFVALVGGIAGLYIGVEKARREQTLEDLERIQARTLTEKRRFESLLENSPSAVADLRYADGRPVVERANPAFQALHDRASADGEKLFDVVPLEESATEDDVVAHIERGENYETDVTVVRPDERGHYQLRVIPYEIGNAADRAFALFTDVTELRRTQKHLEESVDRLEASNDRLEQFAYAASHDLQEPLRMVSSYLQLLERRYADELDEDAREFIDFAVDGADRMQTMIQSLLEYSRVTTGGDPLTPTDTEALLDDVLTDLEPRIAETDATITTQQLPTVPADRDQLAQVFRNLITNAIKYSGDAPPRVYVGAETAGEAWQFWVADEGVGIDEAERSRIFEVFQRAHSRDEVEGSGIGLALCQRIVERHGGEIWVESVPGEGATFYFTIPMAEGDRPTLDAAPPEGTDRTPQG